VGSPLADRESPRQSHLFAYESNRLTAINYSAFPDHYMVELPKTGHLILPGHLGQPAGPSPRVAPPGVGPPLRLIANHFPRRIFRALHFSRTARTSASIQFPFRHPKTPVREPAETGSWTMTLGNANPAAVCVTMTVPDQGLTHGDSTSSVP